MKGANNSSTASLSEEYEVVYQCSKFGETRHENELFVMLFKKIAPTVIVIGLLGNMIAMYTLTMRSQARRIAVYFRVLALWDAVFLMCCGFVYVYSAFAFGNINFYGFQVYVYKYLIPVMTIARVASVWVLLWLVIERHHAVARPISHWLNVGSTKRYGPLIIINLAVILYHSPLPFEFKTIEIDCTDDYEYGDNETTRSHVISLIATDMRLDRTYVIVYKLGLSIIVSHFGPFITHLILVVTLLIRLKKTAAFNIGRSVNRQSVLHHLTIAVLLLELKFLLSSLLSIGLNVHEVVMNIFSHDIPISTWAQKLGDINNFILVCNAASNMVVYLCCLVVPKRPRRNRSTSTTAQLVSLVSVETTFINPLGIQNKGRASLLPAITTDDEGGGYLCG